jgi:dTDP-4-dehydrorhamnose reductase
MKILLFGAHGQLGRRLVSLLEAKGEVRAVDQQELDLRDLTALRARLRAEHPELVVNAAAYTAVDAAQSDAENARLVNAEAPRVMAEAARELGALLIHYSTDYVFDGRAHAPYDEESPVGPLGVYGATKLAGEQAVAAAGAPYVTLRTAWLYSNYGKNFLNTMLRLTGERDELRVVNDQFGSPTYSDLVAEATVRMLDGLYAQGRVRRERCGLYHLTCSGTASWWEFASAIVAQAGYRERVRVTPIPTSEYPTPVERPAYSVLSNEKFERVFGFGLPDWRAGLRRCLAERAASG